MARGRDEAGTGRVARLDGIPEPDTGGGAEPAGVPVARLGHLLEPGEGAGAPGPEAAGGAVDLGRIGAVGAEPGGPVADFGAAARAAAEVTSGDDGPDPAGLFDRESLGEHRTDVAVVELGPAALRRRPARGGRTGGRKGDRAERDRADGTPGGRPDAAAGHVTAGGRTRPAADADGPADQRERVRPGGRGERRRRVPATEAERPVPAPAGPAESGPPERADEPRGRRRGSRGGPAELDPDADPVAVAREVCLRLLTDRARTRQELAQALRRKGVPDDAAHSVLERFDEVGLIDDAAFAGQWVRSRHAHRGLARRAIAMELRRKGVSEENAGEALAEVDADSEERRARELVDRKLRSITATTAEQRASAARRLVGMLARKGYGAGIAYRVVREALAERGAEVDELGAEPVDD